MKMGFRITCGRAITVLAAAALWPASARADRRAYAVTYEAVTAAEGGLDVELWNTYSDEGEVLNGAPAKGYRGMLELEYGITSRWDVALYNILDVSSETNTTGYGGFRVETRYRVVQPGRWFVDPVIYLEYQFLRHGDARHKAELKLIVSKDVGPWNVALNAAAEVERLVDGGWVPETEYAAGVSRELLGPTLKLGVEAFGKAEKPPDEETEAFLWVGPALSWATGLSGPMHGLWVTLGAGKGIAGASKSWYATAVAAFQF
jgi:hypothetical protein